MIKRYAFVCALAVCIHSGAGGQTSCSSGSKSARFDVVSIKESRRAISDSQVTSLANGVSAKGVSVKNLVSIAFGVRLDRIGGGPNWLVDTTFDIEAKCDNLCGKGPAGLDWHERREMLIPVLCERFGLVIHWTSSSATVFSLVQAPGGSKLRAVASQSSANVPSGISVGPGLIEGKAVSAAVLAQQIGSLTNYEVRDETGLTGAYDFSLTWQRTDVRPGGGEEQAAIVDALSDQLGLRLKPARGLIDVLMIDEVHRPTPN
jgi:uncharacterized protein (TIGR03435 family)